MEDDLTSASALRTILTRRGCSVQMATLVAEARSLVEAAPPDWIVLDLMLPDGDGTGILQLIRAKELPTRVVVTTAVGDADRLQAVRDLKPTALLRKPISLRELLATLGLESP